MSIIHRPPRVRQCVHGLAMSFICSSIVLGSNRAAAHVPAPSPVAPASPPLVEEDTSEAVEVVVLGKPQPVSASQARLEREQLHLLPRRRPGDLVEIAPGLISVQHAGGGKSNQYFLRGFDIDHGTDLRFEVDGMPVNMPSHGHGQGYADLHFLIPELVESEVVYKGPYLAEFGDFATVGALRFELSDELEEPFASATIGQFGVRRGLLVASPASDDWRSVLAVEGFRQDGPFEHAERLERLNAVARVTRELGPGQSATFTWMGYGADWNASGQLPLREVEAGRLGRFGSLDPSEGGTTQRQSLAARYRADSAHSSLFATATLVRYDWRLYSNFTFFLDDAENGDQLEQTDGRDIAHVAVRAANLRELAGVEFRTSAGLEARHDSIANALYHDVERRRLSTTVRASTQQSSLGAFLEETARPLPWLTVQLAARVDRMDVSVEDETDQLGTGDSGMESAALMSPKGSLVVTPHRSVAMFVNYGRGFHSNDARGAVRRGGRATLLVPATGFEVGSRYAPWRELTLSLAAYRLDVESEQVYVGDAGTTEPSERSLRYGIESTLELRPLPWLFADGTLTLNRAVYRSNEGNAGSVALAPTRTLAARVLAESPTGTFGGLQLRHVGERPALEDGSITAQGFTVLSARLGHREGPFEAAIDVDNVLSSEWREVQFATESQLREEAEPVEEIHFAPGWPRSVQVTGTVYF